MKALVIDSEGDVTPLCSRVLRRCGAAEVFRIRTLQAATRQVPSLTDLNIVIVNVDLEDLEEAWPSQFINRFRASGLSVPAILYLTDARSRADISSLERAGCYNMLLKPLNESILEERTRALLVQHLDPQEEFAIVTAINEKMEHEQVGEAEAELEKHLRKHPASLKLHLLRADLLFRRGDYLASKRATSLVLALDPEYGPAKALEERIQKALEEQAAALLEEERRNAMLIGEDDRADILPNEAVDAGSETAGAGDTAREAAADGAAGEPQESGGLLDLFKQDFEQAPPNETPEQREERLRRQELEQRVLEFIMFRRKKP